MEEAKILLPIIAIIISILSMYVARKNIKRQIRIGKLEEILENILYVSNFYIRLRLYVFDLKEIHEKEKNGENVDIDRKEFKNDVEQFLNAIDKNKVQQIGARTAVLTNAYLPNGELKNKILIFNQLIGLLFFSVFSQDYYNLKIHYPSDIPRRKKMGEFLISIENELIKEMKLGYSSFNKSSLDKYREDVFKKEMEINDK